jgi:hypothetical protein
MPQIPGITSYLGESIYQPPFKWKECSGTTLCINFTYNVNAIYRIFNSISEQGLIFPEKVDNLVDQACLKLAQIYKAENHFVMMQMNNNFNMYFISKVVESIVGKKIYNSEFQEYRITQKSLTHALESAKEHKQLSVREKMGIALGKGVTFTESRFAEGVSRSGLQDVESITYKYFNKELAIDDREILISMIDNIVKDDISLVAILDDTAETVDDLLWMQDLLVRYPKFKLCLLVNKAQISINFSSQMLFDILKSPLFNELASRYGGQFSYLETYSPFISFQYNFLEESAKNAISKSDIIYIKGANFFETCQIPEKDIFYGFVVYGPISRLYTGLEDYDAVFAYVPAGQTGYIHNQDKTKIQTLKEINTKSKYSLGGQHGSI